MSNRRFDLGNDNRQLTGALLIGIGVLALLGLTGLFKFIGGLVGAALFGVLAYYAYTQGERRGNVTWRLAAYPLAGLALASILPGSLGGATFLASLGLAFAVYWKLDKERWWAMIPAGVFASLAAVAFLEGFMGASAGWVFLLGLAATFFALTRLEVNPQPWAVWPAGALAVISLMSFTSSGGWVVPVVLIGVGGWMLVRSGAIDLPGARRPTPPDGDLTPPSVNQPSETPPAAPPPSEAHPTAPLPNLDRPSDVTPDSDTAGEHPGTAFTDPRDSSDGETDDRRE